MRIAIVTCDGFNEIDSFVAAHILNRLKPSGWSAEIVGGTGLITSMNGVALRAQKPLEFATEADAVLIGSGGTRRMIEDRDFMARLRLDPQRQLVGSQCSGSLILHRLGFLEGRPVCVDGGTRPILQQAGLRVLEQPFVAYGNIATAGGCLAAQYLAAWVLWRLGGYAALTTALSYVSPVGEEAELLQRISKVVKPFIPSVHEPAVAP
jgi:transcriptional regulator GlxA family with amidase domain